MAKKDNSVYWIIGIIVIAIIMIGGQNGWFEKTNTITTTEIVTETIYETEETEFIPSLILTVLPNPGCAGDSFTGDVTSNLPGATCTTYLNDFIYESYTLDSFGSHSNSQIIDAPGEAILFVTCRYQNVNYDAQTVTLTVNNCYNCIDSDGTNVLVAGNCQDDFHLLGFPDSCDSLAQINEYICVDNICESILLTCPPGYQCFDGACRVI